VICNVLGISVASNSRSEQGLFCNGSVTRDRLLTVGIAGNSRQMMRTLLFLGRVCNSGRKKLCCACWQVRFASLRWNVFDSSDFPSYTRLIGFLVRFGYWNPSNWRVDDISWW